MPKEATTKAQSDGRLDARAWIGAATALLAEQGIDAVSIEPLAKRLGVTKGSFYWHFKDRDTLLQAVLQDWRRRATLAVIERLEQTHELPRERLRSLLTLPLSNPRSGRGADAELAIRMWGRREPRVLEALLEVDAVRLRYIENLLVQAGVPPPTALVRAMLAYSFLRVAPSLAIGDWLQTVEDCLDVLLKP